MHWIRAKHCFRRGYETEKAEQARKIELMDLDIRQALDRIRELQAKQTHMVDTMTELDEKRQLVNELEKQSKRDREEHDKGKAEEKRNLPLKLTYFISMIALALLKESYETKIKKLTAPGCDTELSSTPLLEQQQLHPPRTPDNTNKRDDSSGSPRTTPDPMKRHISPQQQEEETAAMESIMEYLNEDNSRLRQSLEQKEQICMELQQKILQLQQKWQDDIDEEGSPNYPVSSHINVIQQAHDNHGGDVYGKYGENGSKQHPTYLI